MAGDGSWLGTRPFTVTALDEVSPGIRALRLAPVDGGALADFRPGQHLTVRAENPDGTVQDPADGRSYSVTGPALAAGRADYGLAVRRIPGGAFSTRIHEELLIGDRLHLASPGGVFAIPTHTDNPVVLLAGGIGITPFLSCLETLAATGGTVPEVVLHYGKDNAAGHPFRDRLRELAARIPALTIVDHYAAPGAQDALGRDYDRTGFITVEDIDPGLIARRARFYMCGPQPMRSAVWRKNDGPLLALGEAAGVAMPSGCRVGQCESCACTVLKGTAAHLVTPSEDLPDTDVLTCQSLPTSDLVLDL